MIKARPQTALALALLVAGAPIVSHAQTANRMICAERTTVVEQLQERYGESVRSIGLAPQNRIVEVYASEETGSWTITITSVDGTTCLMASGQYFEEMMPVPIGEPL